MKVHWLHIILMMCYKVKPYDRVEVHLRGPQYILNDDSFFWINCSADRNPYRNAAEFIINGVEMRLSGTESDCYYSLINGNCDGEMNLCHCSSDGKSYQIRVNNTVGIMRFQIKCSMSFYSEQFISKSAQRDVNVLDASRPMITSKESIPLLVGTISHIQCHVPTTLDITMQIDCFNSSSTKLTRQRGRVFTDVKVIVDSIQRGNNCSCTMSYRNYTRKVFLAVPVTDQPKLKMVDVVECNSTQFVTLACSLIVPDYIKSYGFGPWKFIIDDNFVIDLIGVYKGKTNTLEIERCSYLGIGQYICSAYVEIESKKYWANETTDLKVNSAPYIAKTDLLYRASNIVLSVKYLAGTDINPRWHQRSSQISNSSSMYTVTYGTTFSVNAFDIIFNRTGYESQLVVKSDEVKNGGHFYVVLENEYGNVRYNFTIDPVSNFPQIGIWLLLSGISIIVFMTGMFGVITQVRIQGVRGRSGYHGTDRIYFAAPEDEKYRRVYNTTISDNYIDPVASDGSGSEHYEEIQDLPEQYEDANAMEMNNYPSNYMEIVDVE